MILGTIKTKAEKKDVISVIKTKRFKINYSKHLRAIFMSLNITKHINLSTMITSYFLSLDCGYIALGIDCHYRLKNIGHKGFDIILRLLIFEIEIECTDDRHLEDYEKREQNCKE